MKNIVAVVFCLVLLIVAPLVRAADTHAPASQEGSNETVKEAAEKPETEDAFAKELRFRAQLNAYNIKISNARGLGRVDEEWALRVERDNLKSTVLKTYGSLPAWWEEK